VVTNKRYVLEIMAKKKGKRIKMDKELENCHLENGSLAWIRKEL
jgi:hypothetical protein